MENMLARAGDATAAAPQQASPFAPALWRHLGPLPHRAASRLSDAALASLVARAGSAPALECADLTDCERLTDEGLNAALQPHAASLTRVLLNGCTALSARGVLRALQGAQLAHLGVRGVHTNANHDANLEDEAEACPALLATSLLAPEATTAWKVGLCTARISQATGKLDWRSPQCARLYDETNHDCCACYTLFCIVCEQHLGFSKCHACGTEVCSDCLDGRRDRSGYTCGVCGYDFCPDCRGRSCASRCGLRACERCVEQQDVELASAYDDSDDERSFTCSDCRSGRGGRRRYY